jgi:ankyrin repeat protein
MPLSHRGSVPPPSKGSSGEEPREAGSDTHDADDLTSGDLDGDGENEVPDDFLDNCEEKGLITAGSNVVDAKQLLQSVWHQNVKALGESLRQLKQSGASFSVSDPVNSSGDTILHQLVRKPGWGASIQVLLQSNVLAPNELAQLLNTKNYAGNTALHVASARGHEDYVGLLLNLGADVMSENERKKTALMISIEMGQVGCVTKLAAFSSALVLKNESHNLTSLEVAVELGQWDIANKLFPFFPDSASPTTLQTDHKELALTKRFFQLVREEEIDEVFELVKAHPTLVHSSDEGGRSPLHLAVLGRPTSELPELLLARDADINKLDPGGNTPLHWAACHASGAVFGKYLIESGAQIDIANREGNLPLHMAVFAGNLSLVEYLLTECNPAQSGLRQPNIDENTPLHIVCALPNHTTPAQLDVMISLMTEKRAETSAVNSRKETPLHIAAAAGCTRIHPSLCDALHAKDIYGNTPLLSAARALNLVAVQNLLDMGSSLDTANSDNENILHLLASSRMENLTEDDALHCISLLKKLERKGPQKETIRQLLNRTTISTTETPLFVAVASNRLHLAKFFLRRGNAASSNAQSIEGNTPLHLAAQSNARAMVDLLLRKEANPIQPNREGYSPLHYCCHPSHTSVADRLLKKMKPSDLLAVTSEGLSTLHLAAQTGNLHLVQKILEKAGASASPLLQLRTQHDNTALIYAMSNNHSKVAAFLAKRNGAFERGDGEIYDRVEFRKEPFPHLYPVINHEHITGQQKLDIFSSTYNIFEGRLRDETILVLEANSASASVSMAHEVAIMR